MKKLKQILTGLSTNNILLIVTVVSLIVFAFFVGLSNSKKEVIQIKSNYNPYVEEIRTLREDFENRGRKIDSLITVKKNLYTTKEANKKKTNDKIEVIKHQSDDSTILLLRTRFN